MPVDFSATRLLLAGAMMAWPEEDPQEPKTLGEEDGPSETES